MIKTTHIVNICGAPGFGKSTLAIHVGYALHKENIDVRYIDTDENTLYGLPSEEDQVQSTETSLSVPNTDLSKLLSIEYTIASDSFIVQHLISWSQTITIPTVLILDNCDRQVYEPTRRGRFIVFLRKLIKLSNNKLSIIFTSEQHIFLEDDFEKFKIGELSEPASIKLLQLLAPNITVEDAKIVVDSVERCPLALKVLGRLIHFNGKLTHRLRSVLLDSPLVLLNKSHSDQKQRFWFIMRIALERVSTSEMSIQCGHFLSLFPGSFQYLAARSILPDPENCLDTYVDRSLIDEYSLGEQSRYKMHKLIKEFFRLNGNNIYLELFEEKFGQYFAAYVLQYADLYLHRKSELNLSREHEYNSEIHNIRHLLDIILSDNNPSLKSVQVLAFSVFTKKLTKNDLKHHFQSLLETIIEVCNFLGTDNCFDIYPHVAKELLQECKCNNLLQFLSRYNPCSNIIWCKVAEKVLDYRRINEKLTKNERNYLERLNSWHCLQNSLIYKCQKGYLALTILLILTLFVWYEYRNSAQSRWVYYLTLTTYIVCMCDSLMIPVLVLAEEKIVRAETIEVSLLLLNVYFLFTYTSHAELKYSIWCIIMCPLIILASQDHLDYNRQFLGRLILFNSFQLGYMSYLYCQTSEALLKLIKRCTFFSFCSILTTWIVIIQYGSIGSSAIIYPYVVSWLLNIIIIVLMERSKTIDNKDYVYLSFVIFMINLILPWNVFCICF